MANRNHRQQEAQRDQDDQSSDNRYATRSQTNDPHVTARVMDGSTRGCRCIRVSSTSSTIPR
jgi:hypothetical protein